MSYSVVEYYGGQTSRCGYCKQEKSCNSHGMHAYFMLCQDYQDLIDRGWRRSGQYCYKPNMKITCCPCYTIKCDTTKFQLSKSHKKVLKRMNKFLRDGVKESKIEGIASEGDQVEGAGLRLEPEIPNVAVRDIKINDISGEGGNSQPAQPNRTQSMSGECLKKEVASSSKPEESQLPRKKAKQMRLERKEAKLAAKGIPNEPSKKKGNEQKSLRNYIEDVSHNDRHKLKVVLVPSNKGVTNESFNLYKKYQIAVHKDSPNRLTMKQFERFLVKSPLKRDKSATTPPEGFGSFHQQYWLDDKLIAVGVIDILPYCVSSVYLFYDPDYSFLSLGTYGSLREIDFTHQLSEIVPSLKYYYMGFYIHSCPKMKYKGKLVPSYLLCPETYTWHELNEDIRQKLDNSKYSRFTNDSSKTDIEEFVETDLDAVLVLLEGSRFSTYRQYIQSFNIESVDTMLDMIRSRIYAEITGENDERDSVLEYGKLVGKPCSQRMLYVIS